MLKKYRYAKVPIAVSILCLIIFSVIVDLLFIQYGKRIDREFQHLEEENLTSDAVSQSRQVEARITELLGRMKATGDLLTSTGIDPEGEWFTKYLEDVSTLTEYRITYLPIGLLKEQLNMMGSNERDYEIFKQLERGEPVLADLRYSNRLQGYYFAVAQPVVRDGRTIGTLRSVMAAGVLTDNTTDHVMHETFKQYIVSQDGTVLYSDKEDEVIGENLLIDLRDNGLSEEVLEQVHKALQGDCDMSIKISIPGQKVFYITTAAIGYKKWNIVKFSYTDKVNVTSKEVMKHTVFITCMVISLIVAACAVVFGLIYSHEKTIFMEQARYRTLASFSDIIIFQYNIKEDYLEFSPNVSEYFEIGSDHIEKLRKHELTVVHPEDRTLLFEYFHRAKKTGMPQKWEMRFKNSQDMYFWGECRCQMVGGNGMGPGFLIGTILDISDRKKRELDLLNKANRDGLTGILNKKAIEAGVNDLIKTHGDGFLFMIDLDNFKHVNDTYGHGEGDSLLIRIARMLRSIFREHDPVARVGGDEFIAFMSDTKNQDIARLKVEMIFSKLDEISLETGYDVAASIGIAVCPADGTDFQKLYEAADQAMYQAKKSGKNGYAFTGHEKED